MKKKKKTNNKQKKDQDNLATLDKNDKNSRRYGKLRDKFINNNL